MSDGRPWFRWRHPVVLLGVVLAVSMLCGLVVQRQAFLIGQGAGILLVLGLLVPRLTMAGTTARASFSSRRGMEGESIELGLSIRHCFGWKVRGLWLSLLSDAEEARAVGPIPPRTESRQPFAVCFTRRGRIDATKVRLWTKHPLGIARGSQPVQVESSIIIWPKPASIPFEVEIGPDESAVGSVSRFGPGNVGEFSGLRSFREGDRLRRVHWAQTARRDQLIVCEMQSVAFPQATISLDLDPLVHVGKGSDSSLEWSVRIAAGIVRKIFDQGGRVSLVLGDPCLQSPDRSDGLTRLMDGLALAQPTPGQSLDHLMDKIRSRDTSIVITTDIALKRSDRAAGRRCGWVVLRTRGFNGSLESPADRLPIKPLACMIAPGVWEVMDEE
jgi:uncharacterized protein (DUF58 family)